MARLVLQDHEAAIYEALGADILLRARAHLTAGEVMDLRWDPRTGQVRGSVREGRSRTRLASGVLDAAGVPRTTACDCEDHPGCAHPTALALAAASVTNTLRIGGTVPPASPVSTSAADVGSAVTPSPWESALSRLVETVVAAAPQPPAVVEPTGVGLQFELIESAAAPAPRRSATRPQVPRRRIALRPVVPGRTGWVRSGISWSNVSYAGYGRLVDERHLRLLREILLLATAGQGHQYFYGSQPQAVFLDSFGSRRIWDLLAEAQELGLPMTQPGKASAAVVVVPTPARVCLQAGRDSGDLVLRPALAADCALVEPDSAVLVGNPAHGLAWWPATGAGTGAVRVLRLAALARPLDRDLATLLAGGQVRIPAADEERFFRRFYPGLRGRVDVTPTDESVRLPDLGPATLSLTGHSTGGQRLSLIWEWTVPLGDDTLREPLWSSHVGGAAPERDRIIQQVTHLVREPGLGLVDDTPTGPRLVASATLTGDAMIRFLAEVAPRLATVDGVTVDLDDAAMAYHEASDTPTISFIDVADGTGEHTDWFDLGVQVRVGGEPVPFTDLFTALAEDHRYLILPSGTYFNLDRPEFHQLRDLIEEARQLLDAPPDTLRVGRFHAAVWDELGQLGEVTGEAGAWQAKVRALADVTATTPARPPRGLQADLRPYQRAGFGWLVTLHDHGLGGVLADDMGLGKTLQALALICHARANGGVQAPFLVVAPASVVHNWASEAHRFTPGLTVRTITQTRTRRAVDLAETVTGAHLVVTSYTLFRLEHEQYARLEWSGLILDEAQFVKNPASQGYRCAKQLPAPFKLAVTGTPLENNLTELWALTSITAPGLFPRLDRFTAYYRKPIEKNQDAQRLAQLRRRLRPLMLRRRKAEVVSDLPAKQEQIIELELNPKHRRMYQTYLQRERQKVLGLLGELEKNRFEIFRSLTLLRQASLDIALVDPTQHGVPSTKLDAMAEQLTSLVTEGHRTLVFSQFTRFLQAARTRLEAAGISCCYLDGTTRGRADVISAFKQGTTPVFLISLKAGGFGLNLTEADYCILLDPWWNPATEAQAVDRTHRIGQTRPVMVYRLVAKDTIEEKVMALKARKAELFASVLDGGDFQSATLTAADIRELLS